MIAQLWASFRRLPTWVQIWVALILAPVNLISVAFGAEPHGALIASLAVGGMAPNLWIMARERGLSRAMALPHVVIWTPLVVILGWVLLQGGLAGGYARYLVVLLVVDLISLGFDYVDAVKWLRGDRAIS